MTIRMGRPSKTTMMSTRIKLTLGVMCCSMLFGEQHITIPVPFGVYKATVDDSLQQLMKLQLLPVFSPITDTSVPLNGYLTAASNSSDKVMLSPMLEDCRHGDPNCPPTTVNDSFLRNAGVNLENGRRQLRDLKAERLPKSLEPIRRFLLDSLTTALRMEEARREYIQTGAVSPLSAMLDQYCTTGRQGLVRKLEEASDAEKRRELSVADWHNAVWRCYRERSGTYPAEAWKQFARQYHVQETARLLE